MKWFLNMKIGIKMITGFVIVALLAVAMGIFGIINIKSLDDSDTQLYEYMLVPSSQIAALSEEFQRQRVDIREALLFDDQEKIETQIEELLGRRETINALADEFEKRILSDEMRQMFDSFVAAREAYKPLQDQAIQLIREGKKTEAMAMISEGGDAWTAANTEMEAIDALVKNKVEDGKGKAAANTAQAKSVIAVTIIVLAIVLGLSILIGIVISSIVSKPIKATAKCAKDLASGNLDSPLSVKTKDEVGLLAATINGEVRQAFKDIEQARLVSEKQAQYQSNEANKLLINLQRLSRGELNCDIIVDEADEDTQSLHDLFGKISNNLSDAVNTIKGYILEISQVLSEMAGGNLRVGITSEYRGEFIELKESINRIVMALNETLEEINNSAEQVAAGTTQVSEGSQTISQGATEQASSIEELSASIIQIAEQTKQNASNADKASMLAVTAKNDAAGGNEQMKEMQEAMGAINDSSENISKIIKVIDDIAFQTNILALNAAVEAARAGVHGKGFAVVAEEVRNLAARSANAAKETTELIENSIRKVEAGTSIADRTAEALNKIVGGVEQAALLVAQIAKASNEQAAGIAQVNEGIEQLSAVVQTNSATAQEAAAASEELSSQAELLKDKVAQFELKGQSLTDLKELEIQEKDRSREKLSINLSDGEFGKY